MRLEDSVSHVPSQHRAPFGGAGCNRDLPGGFYFNGCLQPGHQPSDAGRAALHAPGLRSRAGQQQRFHARCPDHPPGHALCLLRNPGSHPPARHRAGRAPGGRDAAGTDLRCRDVPCLAPFDRCRRPAGQRSCDAAAIHFRSCALRSPRHALHADLSGRHLLPALAAGHDRLGGGHRRLRARGPQ